MPLQATSGAASYDAFGGGVAAVPKYIEDYFSTFLYTGNNTSQTITNGIDLATKGGLVWIKSRAGTYVREHYLYDTARGTILSLSTDKTGGNLNNSPNGVSAYNTTGFDIVGSLGSGGNGTGTTYTSWSWAKAPKFFDVVTYTGTGSATTIAHNLGSVPGCIIVKRTDSAGFDWAVYHTSTGNTQRLLLNTTDPAGTSSSFWNNTTPTSTVFTVGSNVNTNASGGTYVAYLFAHNAGGFGLTGTDNVISCGSFSGNTTVTLGYEPQWIMLKRTDAVGNWDMHDVMRGWPVSGDAARLRANLSDAESQTSQIYPNATGFSTLIGSGNYIYIAIRRGPMKVPTSGTSVFAPNAYTGGTAGTSFNLGFVPDTLLTMRRNTSNFDILQTRLLGQDYAFTNATTGFQGGTTGVPAWDATTKTTQLTTATSVTGWNASGSTYVNEAFARAPGVHDVVCYAGTGVPATQNHNLTTVPELMIVENRTGNSWAVYAAPLGNTKSVLLESSNASFTQSTIWNNTTPTSTVFTIGTNSVVNDSGNNYIAFLFATCAGVSKVGSYTGNGSNQTINCGFTAGVRFLMVKNTTLGGTDWQVWDTARGITSGNDPVLYLNSTSAEVNANFITNASTGFTLNDGDSQYNASGSTYIFLAIA